MDCRQKITQNSSGPVKDQCQLKAVNFEAHENHTSHETLGLSQKYLVVRRGKPFKLTLLLSSQLWDPHTETLVLEVRLGDMSARIPVQFSDKQSDPQGWSAKIYAGNWHPHSVTIHILSPVLSSVGLYHLLLHVESVYNRKNIAVGKFVLLCNPWLKDDAVYMPLDVQLQEYIKNDYGMVYMGTPLNICRQPWSFGQYEPGVLEACLQLLQASPQHLSDKHKDYILRADPVYLCRVICAMVNCNDDLGILMGKWQGSYSGGVMPTEWKGSADILRRWVSSNCSPVRYGQCWVFASVLCTVMRVLGIPSRVVTVFNAAHDTNGNIKIEEYFSSRGEKLNLSKDSIWNFHVWVECWMRRMDLGEGFDGWQVVDPTPQEKSAGIFCCGPCPLAAIQQRFLNAPYDSSFIYAAVDADIIRLIVRDGLVVGSTVDTECVGQLIYTKSIGSDKPLNLTQTYKSKITFTSPALQSSPLVGAADLSVGVIYQAAGEHLILKVDVLEAGKMRKCKDMSDCNKVYILITRRKGQRIPGTAAPNLEVSLNLNGVPSVGDSIAMCVMVTNKSSSPRVLVEHLNAQLKEYNRNPRRSFWRTHKQVHIQPLEVLKLYHTIPPSVYESVLAGDDVVNVAVVVKDVRTKERVLAAKEFSMGSPQITLEIEGGNIIQMKKEYTAHVTFINMFNKTLAGAVLSIEGDGLLQGRHETRLILLQPGNKIEKKVSIMATLPGTKVLMTTFSHRQSPRMVSRTFHKVSVKTELQLSPSSQNASQLDE